MSQHYIKVTNNNDFTIDDHFDGVHYVFETGKTVSVPFDAACHIFGIEHPDQVNDKDQLLAGVCRRWGWNTPDTIKDKKHIELFNNIKLALVSYRVVEDSGEDESEGLPASRVEVEPQSAEVKSKASAQPPMEVEIERPARRGRTAAKMTVAEDEDVEDSEGADEEAA